MKLLQASLLTFVLLLSSIVTVFAYSEETEMCIDRVTGRIYGYLDYDITSPMQTLMTNFCLKTNVSLPYSEMTEFAKSSRNMVDDFFARSLVVRDVILHLGDQHFESGNFSQSAVDGYVGHWLNEYLGDIRDLKISHVRTLQDINSDELGEFPFITNDIEFINDEYDAFLEDYNLVKRGLDNHYVCQDGKYDIVNHSNCTCFQGYSWDASELTCTVATTPLTTEDETYGEEEDSPFYDLSSTHRNFNAISYLKDNGIIGGYPDGSFKPDVTLNRAELLKILVEGKGTTPDSKYKNCFPDVGEDWYAKYICYAKNQGWIGGYPDGTFKPSQAVNKAEAVKMLLEIFDINIEAPATQTFLDIPVDTWFSKYINTAQKMGLLEETGSYYSPALEISRGGISENIYRLLIQL